MKLNRKGVTIVEIIVSLALISTVLIFLMNMFLNMRGTYLTSKIDADYDMLVSTFVKSIGDDIIDYGLENVEYKRGSANKSEVILTFNTYRPTKLSQKIKKVIELYIDSEGEYHLSYSYDSSVTDNVVSAERITNVVRKLPSDCIVDAEKNIHIIELDNRAVEIKIPITNSNGTDYSINVYGVYQNDDET